jgi:hypothetical protein
MNSLWKSQGVREEANRYFISFVKRRRDKIQIDINNQTVKSNTAVTNVGQLSGGIKWMTKLEMLSRVRKIVPQKVPNENEIIVFFSR